LLSVAVGGIPAWGAAFTIQELGGRATGMGGAFVAVADDGSALYYNPAGISFQEGLRMEMEGTFVHGDFNFTPSSTPKGTIVPPGGYPGFISPQILVVPNMYMSKTLNRKWTAGFGAFTPFGLGANWTNFKDSAPADTKFVGRFQSSRPQMQSIWFQPTVSYRVSRSLSIAAGVAWVHSHALLEQSILNPANDGIVFGQALASNVFPGADPAVAGKIIARLLPEGRFRFAGVSNNIGANGGLLYWHARSKTRFGLNYRTAVVQHFDGKASFAFTQGYALQPAVSLSTLYTLFPNQPARVTFTTPGTYAAGIATEAFGRNLFALDFQVQDYQRVKDVLLNFTETSGTVTPAEEREVFDFHNAIEVRVGWERKIKGFTIRGGGAWDQTPVPDAAVSPLWPDSTRLNFNAGFSKMRGSRELSVYYQFTKFLNRTTNVPANADIYTNGDWNSNAQVFGFSVRFRAGGKPLEFAQ
jgi:long-chain fatty acid transport protein